MESPHPASGRPGEGLQAPRTSDKAPGILPGVLLPSRELVYFSLQPLPWGWWEPARKGRGTCTCLFLHSSSLSSVFWIEPMFPFHLSEGKYLRRGGDWEAGIQPPSPTPHLEPRMSQFLWKPPFTHVSTGSLNLVTPNFDLTSRRRVVPYSPSETWQDILEGLPVTLSVSQGPWVQQRTQLMD